MAVNPRLEKIIKLTQSQYNSLSNGGSVGSYTGLNDNYLYLIQDTTEYLPVTNGNTVVVSGGLRINTATDSNPFKISRGNSDTETVFHSVKDMEYYIKYRNDESQSKITWELQNTDTESGNGVHASSHYMVLNATEAALTLALDNVNVVLTNDSRLSNARTPTSHTHGNIQNGGTITSSAVTSASGVVVVDSSSKIQKVTNMSTFRSIIGAAGASYNSSTGILTINV